MISGTKRDVYIALRALIQGVIGDDVEVIVGLGNRVSMPLNPFVAITAISSVRQATNVDTDTDYYPSAPGVTAAEQSTKLGVQLDFYGPQSNSWATMVSVLFRDEYACEALGQVCQPLYADNPMMMPLTTAEDQYLERWTVTAAIQYNPVTTTAQSFATTIDATAIEVDAIFHP